MLQQWWSQHPIYIPPQWKAAHLTFIHKPGKRPDRLGHLRPLALLEPIGKSILGLITVKFAANVQPLISRWPQLALPRRSPFDAIRRVVQHCVKIRHITMQQRRSVHQRADNVPCRPVCGGIQVLLDANKAFDMVPRQPLFSFLNSLPINQELVSILGSWHSNTTYVVHQGCTSHAVGTGRGVRQGCRAAPVLWLCHTLSNYIDEAWVKNSLTAFADDFHCCECFHDEQ